MPLKLIHGPPNSGRAGLLRRRFVAVLERDPVLVVPNVDDVFAFERELCAEGAALGGAPMTFAALFRTVATAGGVPPGAELSPAQRLRAIEVGGGTRLGAGGHCAGGPAAGRGRRAPGGWSAPGPAFSPPLARRLGELQPGVAPPAAV